MRVIAYVVSLMLLVSSSYQLHGTNDFITKQQLIAVHEAIEYLEKEEGFEFLDADTIVRFCAIGFVCSLVGCMACCGIASWCCGRNIETCFKNVLKGGKRRLPCFKTAQDEESA